MGGFVEGQYLIQNLLIGEEWVGMGVRYDALMGWRDEIYSEGWV